MTSSSIPNSSGAITPEKLSMQKPQMHGTGGPPPKPNATEMANKLSKDLNLTDDQKAKLVSIFQQNIDEMDAKMKDNTSSANNPEAMKTVMDQNMANVNKQIKTILSDEQSAKFQSFIDARKNEQFNTPKEVENSDRNVDYYV